MAFVRDRGADELTLATLATEAGVSRPIAYDHFETRGGLLLALFQQIQDRQVEALCDALVGAHSTDLRMLADMMSAAYFGCYDDVDTDALAISAALQGDDGLAAEQRAVLDRYIDVMCEALRPYSTTSRKDLRLRCAALLGAAESLARERQHGRATVATVVRTLSSRSCRPMRNAVAKANTANPPITSAVLS